MENKKFSLWKWITFDFKPIHDTEEISYPTSTTTENQYKTDFGYKVVPKPTEAVKNIPVPVTEPVRPFIPIFESYSRFAFLKYLNYDNSLEWLTWQRLKSWPPNESGYWFDSLCSIRQKLMITQILYWYLWELWRSSVPRKATWPTRPRSRGRDHP